MLESFIGHVCRTLSSVWEVPGGLGGSTPSSFLHPPSLIYSFVLGGQKITPQIALVYTVCAIIALAQFLSRHLSTILYRYSIMIAVKIENL